tara:strand:+ start:250 stop:417 length:168 start_codon:yes stop_codon:yes gene_type:complete
MTMKQFISENKTEIDSAIRAILKLPDYKLNDHERRQWIENNENLYMMARSQGVKI